MQRLILLVLVGLLTSCKSGQFYTKDIPYILGWEESKLVSQWGSAIKASTYTVAQLASSPEPYHASTLKVLSLYAADKLENRSVQIKILSWQKGRILYTAWLHKPADKWVVIYAEKWNMDVVE
jgi:hypothetical protein